MVKKEKYTEKDKVTINSRHVEIFNRSLDGIELMLDGMLNDLKFYDGSFLELPKTTVATFDFIISALTKIQKGQRLALGLDDEVISEEIEPKISIIENVDLAKV